MSKNYSLVFLLDEKTNYKIRKVVGEVGRVFEGQDISVRWFKPEHFFIEIMNFGSKLNIVKRFFLEKTISKLIYSPIEISLNRCEVGINRKYKELVYLSIDSGGDRLRDIVYTLRKSLLEKDFSNYIPRVSIGRISKDLTVQEFTNLKADIQNIEKELNIKSINFVTSPLSFIEYDNDQLKVLRKFETAR